mmetsp:Transcript_25797/g.57602  ORF Transcript_25797/g.57602 Transcript_25797/m.57602 type:complete len:257 (-) Transcript_25797:608-1378(-)
MYNATHLVEMVYHTLQRKILHSEIKSLICKFKISPIVVVYEAKGLIHHTSKTYHGIHYSTFPNRSSGQSRTIGRPTMFSVLSEPHTLESTDTELQSPITNTSSELTLCSWVGCIYFSISRSGSVSQKSRRPSTTFSSLTSTSPSLYTVTLSPGAAAILFTNKSRLFRLPPLWATICCSSLGGENNTMSPTLFLRKIVRDETLSTNNTSPTFSVGSIDLDGMKNKDIACERRNAVKSPVAAVNKDPKAESMLYMDGV